MEAYHVTFSSIFFKTSRFKLFVVVTSFLLIPVDSAFATSGIANTVMGFCAPQPTVPDVGSCSSCHTTTNNRGPNDLNAAGMAALSGNYAFFCPNANQTPPPTTTPPATPTPPPGGPGNSTPGTGMGMGSGAEMDDDDDDEMDDDDDDMTAPAPAGASGSLGRLRSILGD
ncbi:hypothetical protein [Kaarinaea lacus]